MLAPFVGGGLALVIGGLIYPALAPLVATMIGDPRNGAMTTRRGASIADLARYVAREWRFCLPYLLALALLVMVLNAHIAWMPSPILRRFPIGEAGMGASFGVVYLVAGSLGTLGAGLRLSRGAEEHAGAYASSVGHPHRSGFSG